VQLIDTHQHLWDPAQFPYAWLAGLPALNRRFDLEDYRAATIGSDIVKTIFMECDVDESFTLAEARHIQTLANRHPSIVGLIASGRPERDDFRAQLAALAELPALRGMRRVLHTQPDELSQTELFAKNLRLLPAFGLTFDLCVLARQLPIALQLAEKCPGVTFILDHCGVPNVKGRALEPWRTDLARLALLPNVNCKVSGLVAYADPAKWTVSDLHPWVEYVLAQFGWDRVVWGGDWPVCTLSASLARWVSATQALVAHATTDQRARLFHRNAERIYRV
jgi:predicted TIM-barrel fold metal-dependent hydrolase